MTEYLIARLSARMRRGERIASITAYDYFTALLAREADMDFVLVGDSLGNVVQGQPTTVPVTLDEMVYHTRIVCRHFPAERVILDMPFGTFKLDAADTVQHCARAFKDSGCGAVKLEGAGSSNLDAIETLTNAGVPVLCHLGLLPQRVHADGGYRYQGKTPAQADKLLADAIALESAGALGVVLECVVEDVAARITDELAIPTIGIGSGPRCDGQIAVIHDILGMLPGQAPAFAKQFVNLFGISGEAMREYMQEVKTNSDADNRGREDAGNIAHTTTSGSTILYGGKG
ncbi:MAG: 3-methyl-2-oxobutanoate hydroxymethyltransferase [bacterium]|nr:3-methyl-2-oxobutanoate hydroxymethyltransferase [bacterium]